MISISQNAKYAGSDWWKWSVWLDGTASELNEVDSVIYRLHPTFHDRVRKVTNRDTKFRLESSGWGEFAIRVKINLKNGEVLRQVHELRLLETREIKKSIRKQSRRVFLSASLADRLFTDLLRNALVQHQYEIKTISDFQGTLPTKVAVEQTLRTCSALIAILSETLSPWVAYEMGLAKAMGIPVIPVQLPGSGAAFVDLENTKVISVKQTSLKNAAKAILKRLDSELHSTN
jgi:prokaryotic YEATS domain/TIR domain